MSNQLRCKNEAYKENNTAPALKHGGDSVMFLLCFGASGTAGLKNLKTIKASWSEM